MFKQMFDAESSTLTYLIVDDNSQEAVLIDPVASHIDDYFKIINVLNCQLKYSLENTCAC